MTDFLLNPDYLKLPYCIADCEENRRDFAGFVTSAMRADSCIGRVLNALEEEGLTQETLIIYTTDHGIAFPFMKCNLYDTGIGVSLIIKYKGNKSAGTVKDSLVSHADIYPTLCDILNIPKPQWLTGKSLTPILNNEADEVNDAVFAEITYHAAAEPQRCIRTKRYKYICRYGEWDKYVPSNIDGGGCKNFVLSEGLLLHKPEKEMLFDLSLDAAERKNVIEDEAYREIAETLKKKLNDFMEKTEDFAPSGQWPKVKGAVLNKVTCIEPDSKNPDDYERL